MILTYNFEITLVFRLNTVFSEIKFRNFSQLLFVLNFDKFVDNLHLICIFPHSVGVYFIAYHVADFGSLTKIDAIYKSDAGEILMIALVLGYHLFNHFVDNEFGNILVDQTPNL